MISTATFSRFLLRGPLLLAAKRRLVSTEYPDRLAETKRTRAAGRLVCSLNKFARENMGTKAASLASLAEEQLDTKNAEELAGTLEDGPALALLLLEKMAVLPLTHRLTAIAGNLWNKTLGGQRANRILFLLLHEFAAKDILCPESTENTQENKGYAGGLVLEPEKGLHTTCTLLLDFNSLYPSIIQEYGICFTTYSREDCTAHRAAAKKDGCLPEVLRRLVAERKQLKKQIAECGAKQTAQQLETRQKALKLTANSVYGCLGHTGFRFYAPHLAELVTALGRQALKQAAAIVSDKLGYKIIYGDTDSLIIKTNTCDRQEALGHAQKNTERNQQPRQHA